MNYNSMDLIKKIQKIREKLERLISENDNLNDPEIIKTSQMLDELLNMLENEGEKE